MLILQSLHCLFFSGANLTQLSFHVAKPWPLKIAEEWLENVGDTIINILQELQKAAILQTQLFCFHLIYMEKYL